MQINTMKTARASARIPIVWHDFQVVLVGAVVLLALIILGDGVWFLQPVRMILSLVYVLFVPGYCLMAVLFPKANDLDGITRVGMSLGLSMALVPLLTLILEWSPWSIRPWPILLSVYVATVLFIIIALWRRTQLPASVAYAPRLDWQRSARQSTRVLTGSHRALILVGVLLLAGYALWSSSALPASPGLTEFYILGQEGQARDYPRVVAPAETLTVTMGIMNQEHEQHSYRVELWVMDGVTLDQRRQIAQAGPFTLSPGQRFEEPVSWQMPHVGDNQQVEVLLFLDDQPTSYRQLRLWLDVTDETVRLSSDQ